MPLSCRIPPEGVEPLLRRRQRKLLFYDSVIVIVGATAMHLMFTAILDRLTPSPAISLTIGAVISITVVGITRRTRGEKLRGMFASYELFLDDDRVSRTMKGPPELTVRHEEIERVVENANGDLIIEGGAAGRNRFGIPRELERFQEVRSALAARHPFTQRRFTIGPILRLLAGGIMLFAATVTAAVSHSPAVVIGAIVALIFILGWGFVWYRHHPNALPLTGLQKGLLIALPVLVILLVILQAVLRLVQKHLPERMNFQ